MLDSRVLQTRRLLKETLEKLLETRRFEEISIDVILHAAHVDRATFDEHYEDRTGLLECMVASRFGGLLEKRGVRFDGSNTDAVKGIALCVCDCLAELPGGRISKLDHDVEAAVIEVVRWIILEGITAHLPVNGTSPSMVASAAAWAIYGAAKEWILVSGWSSTQKAAEAIARTVSPIVECEKPTVRPRIRSWAS